MPSVGDEGIDGEILVTETGVEGMERARRGRWIFTRASRSSGEDLPGFPRRFFPGTVDEELNLRTSADTFCRLGKPETR